MKCHDCEKTFEPLVLYEGGKLKPDEESYIQQYGPYCPTCRQDYRNQHPWNLAPLIKDALDNTLADIGQPENFDSLDASGASSDLVDHDGYIQEHREDVILHHLIIMHRVGRALVVHKVPPFKSGPKPKKGNSYKVRTDSEEPMTWIKFQEKIRTVYGGKRGRAYESDARTIGKLTVEQVNNWIKEQRETSNRADKGLNPHALLEYAKEVENKRNRNALEQNLNKTVAALDAKAKKAEKGSPGDPYAGFDEFVSPLYHGDFQKMPLTEKVDLICSDPPYRAEDNTPDWKLFKDLAEFANKHLKENRPMILMLGQRSLRDIADVITKNGFRLYWICCTIYNLEHKMKHDYINTKWKPILIFLREKDKLMKSEKLIRHINLDVFTAGQHIKHRIHRDQQDVETFRQIIRAFSERGELVCDPCMGSGTTGVACLDIGKKKDRRRFCGAENDQKPNAGAYKKAVKRLKAVWAGKLTE